MSHRMRPGEWCTKCRQRIRGLSKYVPCAKRRAEALYRLRLAGANGLTDDEMDRTVRKWGHQGTTPVMCYLRAVGLIGWKRDKDDKRVRRKTRRKALAGVNVLARFL